MQANSKKVIVTTSWDDGHPKDLKVADLLDKYCLRGTFYVPVRNLENNVVNDSELRIIDQKFEIGGHTVNHLYLDGLKDKEAFYEISQCKIILQEKLGKSINAFCFPGGKYSNRDIEIVLRTGFSFGRTTRLLHTSMNTSNPLMHTTVQVYNHKCITLIGHCAKRLFFSPVYKYNFFLKSQKNFAKLVADSMRKIHHEGGVFHLWGHSWEIEQLGLWKELEDVLKLLAFDGRIAYLDNTECWNALAARS